MEDLSERFERTEAYLKQRLSDYKDTMPVKWWQSVSLLAIYWEWMDYLVKEDLKKKSDLLKKWQRFLMERNTDAIADLLIGFFEAKRRYGRDKERGEDKRDWFTLCKNYCKKNGWNSDEDLLHSLFSSYSWAERRAYRKVQKREMIADSSRSILETLAFAESEMAKKEEEKERKAIERKEKEAEKQRRKEERQRIQEEKKKQKAEKRNSKAQDEDIDETPKFVDEWAMNHYRGDDRDIEDENGDIIPNPKYVNNVDEDSIASNPDDEDDNFDWKESENKKRSKKKKSGQQLEFQFGNED